MSDQTKLQELLAALALYRGLIIDAAELAVGNTAEWKTLRARLLRYLGERGLEERIRAIMNTQVEG